MVPPFTSSMERLDIYKFRKERTEERRKESAQRDVRDEVFDRTTLLSVSRMVSRGMFSQVDYSISTGKVANVFRVTSSSGPRALKVYRISNALFRSIPPYLLHALREEVGSSSFGRLVFAWARREFMALKACHEAGVPVPEPIDYFRNLLLMEFMGEEGLPWPPLIKCVVEKPEVVMKQITRAVRTMVTKVEMVHGDLSPYNVLYDGKRIVLIDMGETIATDHPEAKRLLERDADNFAKYFSRLGLSVSSENLFERMGGKKIP
jgi:RIO kinase 1